MLRNLFWLGILIVSSVFAEHPDDFYSKCSKPTKTIDVLICARKKNPEVQRAKLLSKSLDTLPEKLGQIPNPEFEFETIRGNELTETELSLVQAIELGGKRSARIRGAEAEKREAQVLIQAQEANLSIEIFTKLHRLRQIEIEKNAIVEIAQALSKSISQLKGRAALSPEQQVSMTVFQMALADSKIKFSEMTEEEQDLEQYFYRSTGYSLSDLSGVLPEMPKNFPSFFEKSIEGKSPEILQSLALRDIALSELNESKADAWPTLRIGPIAKLEKGDATKEQSFGFKLSMDLPLLHTNSGAKAHSEASLRKAEELVHLTQSEEDRQRSGLFKVYQNAVRSLSESPLLSEISLMHKKNELLERRGLISSSLFIESHRQRLELIKGRHGREIKAIGSLMQIFRIDGRKIEELYEKHI